MVPPSASSPIGVFDSGIGGLTVLRSLRQILPRESYIYLGDTARLPYGTKSGDTITRYAVQAASHLAAHGIKLLVVACNTASAFALPQLQAAFPHIAVIGVIEPGAERACAETLTGRVAVLCTESTARSGAYQAAIARRAPDMITSAIPCALLVSLAEEGLVEGPVPLAIVRRYLEPILDDPRLGPDTLVLGCTHFPLLRGCIGEVAGPHITLVDSGETTAAHVAMRLRADGLLTSSARDGSLRLLATDGPERFARLAGTFLGHEIGAAAVELVDLTGIAEA